MALQSRLMRRKKWYTLQDAARRLSFELEESVTVRDVLQLALDGDVSICVMLHSQAAKRITDESERIDTPLLFTFEGPDMEPTPIITAGRPVSVDEDSLRYLDGIFELSDASGWLTRMLTLRVTEAPDESLYGGLWAVKEIGGEGGEWLIFVNGDEAPSGKWPDDSSLMVLRSDIDAFLSSLELVSSPCQPAEGDELRALEALGLLAVTVTKQAPRYQRNGKPNKAQIAEAMSQQAVEVYGMSKSKLQRLLSDALDAWEEKLG